MGVALVLGLIGVFQALPSARGLDGSTVPPVVPVAPASTPSATAPSPSAASPEPDGLPEPGAQRGTLEEHVLEAPAVGSGQYNHAGLTIAPTADTGRLIRYDVRVENDLAVDPDEVATMIQRVLDDERSWRGSESVRFELVDTAERATLHAYLVTPGTTDALCAPLLTRGEVSCQAGNRVVLNARRWLGGAPSYGSDLGGYRRYLINHEFGHALGHQHVGCPGAGRPAPVMMQQTKGLGACRKNPWPTAAGD